uniref:Zinc finger PHD-type domain-containing protein n=1 Tax=Leersia perrieri TaxID=77586 RepID=A0A0D9XPB8_9ORYZ
MGRENRRGWIDRDLNNVLCEVCGDVGWEELIMQCNKCKSATSHRYCFDPVIFDESLVEWFCDDCLPNGNEVANLLDMSNQRKPSQTDLGSYIIREANVKKMEITKGLWSWGYHRNRSFKARCDGSDARTKHSASRKTFSSEIIIGEMSNLNDSETEGRGELFSSINGVERAHQVIEGGSNPTSTSMEHMDFVHKRQLIHPSSLDINSMGKTLPCPENMDVVHKMQLLKPSSLDKDYVDKPMPNSENMDVVLKERSHPLNNPMDICEKRVIAKVDRIKPSRQFDRTCLGVSSKAHEIHEFDAGSENTQSLKNGKLKKQRRLILPYEENEDVEANQVDDVNRQSCGDDGEVKKHVDIVAALGDVNVGCDQNTFSQLHPTKQSIRKYFCVQPIDESNWTGIMKIGKDYIPLDAHLSNKACKKVCELSISLPQIMKMIELPMSKVWPKGGEASVPTAESIGLFLFSHNTWSNKEFDELVKHVIDRGIVLETVVSSARLLVFPSVVLPAGYQVFQGKHYLWGAFKHRKDMDKRVALVEQNCLTHLTDEEQIHKHHALDKQHMMPCEALDQEMVPAVKDTS